MTACSSRRPGRTQLSRSGLFARLPLALPALLLAGGLCPRPDLKWRLLLPAQPTLVQKAAAASPTRPTDAGSPGAGRKLVIVESPSKAKTIEKYLGRDYKVMASVGHIRDLIRPKDVPKGTPGGLSKFGVDINNGFTPHYVVSEGKIEVVTRLQKALKESSELFLATDADREGEAIAWHLLEVLKPTIPAKRMVFTEITQKAILKAARSVRELDTALVDAQEARRVLDRIYGFELCPVLWRRIRSGLSAGRVQTPALRLIVEREKARRDFTEASHWDLLAEFRASKKTTFQGILTQYKGKRLARTSDFSKDGVLRDGVLLLDDNALQTLRSQLEADDAKAHVENIRKKTFQSSPKSPFTTSTLQQSAFSLFRWQPEDTMKVAQRLYEGGFISYMRTDSPSLSKDATSAARAEAQRLFGKTAVPVKGRQYASKSKGAQEAHEAIRPAGSTFKSPDDLETSVGAQELKLYRLIWERTIASQMKDSTYVRVVVKSKVHLGKTGDEAVFEAAQTATTFLGWKAVSEKESLDAALPFSDLSNGDQLTITGTSPNRRKTSPPTRFTEGSLVQKLEQQGIGRPSTYASILSVLFKRGYVVKATKSGGLEPTHIGMAVINFLESECASLVEYDFTARMEASLDKIAEGAEDRGKYLHAVYFGSGPDEPGLKALAEQALHSYGIGQVAAYPFRADTNVSLGTDPESGLGVFACDGPDGQWIHMGSRTRQVSTKQVLDSLNLQMAVALIIRGPSNRQGRAFWRATAPAKTKRTASSKTRKYRKVAN